LSPPPAVDTSGFDQASVEPTVPLIAVEPTVTTLPWPSSTLGPGMRWIAGRAFS